MLLEIQSGDWIFLRDSVVQLNLDSVARFPRLAPLDRRIGPFEAVKIACTIQDTTEINVINKINAEIRNSLNLSSEWISETQLHDWISNEIQLHDWISNEIQSPDWISNDIQSSTESTFSRWLNS